MLKLKNLGISFFAIMLVVIGFNYGMNLMGNSGEGQEYTFSVGMLACIALPLLGIIFLYRLKK